MDSPATFARIDGKNVIAGTHVSAGGTANFTFNTPEAKPLLDLVTTPCRTFPFPRNEDVVHRTAIFDELDTLLPPSSEYQSAALWGLGGSG
jgi:hypothetical protein